jgi:hypothetical protein
MSKYYKCNKCGYSLAVDHNDAICTLAKSYRASGICSGSISQEIDKKRYLHKKSIWRSIGRRDKIKRLLQ